MELKCPDGGMERTEELGDRGTGERGGSVSLGSYSDRRKVAVFQSCLHSLPVCGEHPEDAAGTQRLLVNSWQQT